MTVGSRLVVRLVAGITSVRAKDRNEWADVAGSEFDDYDGLDGAERRTVSPGHVWSMCLEPSVEIRERMLNSIDALAVRRSISPTVVAEVLGWLAVTGTDPRTEIDYVQTLTAIVEENSAVPEVALTSQRAAPLVDVLRGITSTSSEERARAARGTTQVLLDLRREEQWGITGVLARAAVVEGDPEVRGAQLDALARARSLGAVHPHDDGLLAEAADDGDV